MNRRILLQAAAPPMVIGLLMSAACLGSAWYINRLQASMADILANNVTSLQAAQGLEISLRQLRFRCVIYLVAPEPQLLTDIHESEKNFGEWLDRAKDTAQSDEEWRVIHQIEEGFNKYQLEFDRAQEQIRLLGPSRNFKTLAVAHPVLPIVEPCHELLRINEEIINETAKENARLKQKLQLVLLLLSLGGPISGLIMGYGLARGWSRSMHRLSVHVRDMAERLDQDVGSVRVEPEGDFARLDAQLQRVVGRVEEVVDRLQRQQRDMIRAQQLTAVGQLAASVAHEIRNPLTSIKMLVQAALRTQNSKPFTRDNLEVVHREVARLEQTVQSFLDFSRPPVLQRTNTDLRTVVTQAAQLVAARARQQRVRVDQKLPTEPVLGNVDAAQMCTVLVNLLINALDAMPYGGCLEMGLEHDGDAIQFTVADTGPGIAAEVAHQLFTPFASTKPSGTGLGLSTSRRIVEEHGGRIVAVNPPGGGACFTITL